MYITKIRIERKKTWTGNPSSFVSISSKLLLRIFHLFFLFFSFLSLSLPPPSPHLTLSVFFIFPIFYSATSNSLEAIHFRNSFFVLCAFFCVFYQFPAQISFSILGILSVSIFRYKPYKLPAFRVLTVKIIN